MDVLLVALGSAGDVLPFCALGRELAARGCRVSVAANPHFAGMVERAGLTAVPLGDEREYLRLLDSSQFMSRVLGFRRVMRWAERLIAPTYELVAARRPSLVVMHPLAFGARVAEARLGVRTATALLSPAILQSAHEPPVIPGVLNSPTLPEWYKRAVWWAVDRLVLDPMIAPGLNRFRARVGVPPLERVFQDGWRSDHLFLALYPEWLAPRQPDGPQKLVFTGFPRYDGEDERADAAAERQTAAGQIAAEGGDGEVVLTAGTGNRRARDFFAAGVEACARLGRRALLLTRFEDQLPPLAPHVRHLSYAPLHRVLAGASALVHHGGIGTAAAALEAGVPQLVTPFAHDQFDNAARLCRLGVAASLRRLQAEPIAAALDRLLSSEMVRARCRELAAQVRADAPIAKAAEALFGYASEAAA